MIDANLELLFEDFKSKTFLTYLGSHMYKFQHTIYKINKLPLFNNSAL